MTNGLLDPEGRALLESLLRPSIALVSVDGRPSATGYFISRDGLLCTAAHTFFRAGFLGKGPISVTVEWQGQSYEATVIYEPEKGDLAVLRLRSDSPIETPPLPVALGPEGEGLDYHSAATLGYAGVEEKLSVAPRLLDGRLGKSDPKNPSGDLIHLDLAEGKGVSGAPILDLARLRVVAHVTIGPRKLRRLGTGTRLGPLADVFPELVPEWREAGRRFDRAVADFLGRRGGPSDGEIPAGVLAFLAADRNRRVVQDFERRGIFNSGLYVPRRLETEIGLFLAQRETSALMIAGLTGSGKTNLLLHLAETLDPELYQPILIPCREVETGDLLSAAFETLGLPHYTPEAAARLLAALPGRTWVLLFEGLNEWPAFRLENFRNAVRELSALLGQTGAGSLKALFSVRSEFLEERLADFRGPGEEGNPLRADLGLFYRPPSGLRRPYLELVCSDRPTGSEEVPELQILYEAYCSQEGYRPKTTFDQLSEVVRRMISLPLLLSFFVQRYNGKEVPDGGLRSSLIEDVILPILNQRGEASEVFRQDAADLLKGLAGLVFERQDGRLGRPYREVKRQVWQDRFIIETLLSASPILSCTAEGDDLQIAFRSDWFYEYFLAGHLWDTHYRDAAGLSEETVRSLLARAEDSRSETHLTRAFVFLAEWVLSRQPPRPELVVLLLNLEDRPDIARAFARSFLDFLRLHGGFATAGERAASLVEILERQADDFSGTGWSSLLDYAEHLEILGEYEAAFELLTAPARLWERAGPELTARRLLSVAYNLFSRHEIDEAYRRAGDPALDHLPRELEPKRRFILGRCLQFQQRYPEAMREFALGGEGPSPFAYRCRHQRAFIRFMEESDYRGARAELETIIPNLLLSAEEDQGSEPRLLHATCLVHLGEYAAAEAELHKVIKARRGARRSHKEGTACRALADLYLRRFAREPALAAIRRASECLETSGHFLSLTYVQEIEAQVLALLDGDLDRAAALAEQAVERSHEHGPSVSWALQTRAFVAVLVGNGPAAREALARAREQGLSPYQELRERFLRLLADFLEGKAPATDLAGLRSDYEDRGYRWYPGVLALMQRAATGEPSPRSPAEALALFGEDIDVPGLRNSYLFARIFPAPGPPAAASPRSRAKKGPPESGGRRAGPSRTARRKRRDP